VRITEKESELIKKAVNEILPDWYEIKLFGSRTEDSKRGGDIDLLISSSRPIDIADSKRKLVIKLENYLGEQKFDLVFDYPGTPDENFIIRIKQTAIILWKNQ
jgi:predicted nucleotidyltransferase